MKLSSLLALPALLLVCSLSVAQEAPAPEAPKGEQVFLTAKWREGDSVRQRTTVETTTEMDNPMAGKITSKQTMVMVGVETFKSVSDKDVVTTELAYESLKIKSATSDISMEWDSEKPDEGDMEESQAAFYKAMIKSKYTLTYDPSGKLVGLKGFDKVLEESLKDADNPMAKSSLKASFGDQAMMRNFGSNSFYPGKLVAKGDSWDKTVDFAMPMGMGTLIVKSKYKLDDLEKNKDGQVAKVTGEGTITLEKKAAKEEKEGEKKEGEKEGEKIEDEPAEEPEMDLTTMFDISFENGKQTSEATLKVESGVTIKAVTRQTFDMKMTMKGEMQMEMVNKIASTVTVELLPPKAAEPAKAEGRESAPPEAPKEGEGK